jgi:site-specific recombinase XerD
VYLLEDGQFLGGTALLVNNGLTCTLPTTISSYLRGVRLYLKWCEQNRHPLEITRVQVQAYTAELITEGKEANTVRQRQAAVRAFARWLVEEDELPEDPLIGLKALKIPTKIVRGLSDDQLRDLIAACKGGNFTDRRASFD